MKKFNFWKTELKFPKKKKNLKEKKLMIYNNIPEETVCFYMEMNETNAECTDDIIIKICAEELGIDVKQEDLDRSHRLGKVKRNDNKQ